MRNIWPRCPSRLFHCGLLLLLCINVWNMSDPVSIMRRWTAQVSSWRTRLINNILWFSIFLLFLSRWKTEDPASRSSVATLELHYCFVGAEPPHLLLNNTSHWLYYDCITSRNNCAWLIFWLLAQLIPQQRLPKWQKTLRIPWGFQ